MLHNLGRRGGLRRAGAIVAGLLLATSAMAGAASAAVGTVTTPTGQNPNPVAQGSYATYTTTVTNTSTSNNRYFKVSALHYTASDHLSFSNSACTQIIHNGSGTATGTLTFRVNTNVGGTTPTGTHNFYITVSDYDNATDCANNNDHSSNDSSHPTGQATLVVLNPQTITFTTPAPSGMVGASGVSVHANASSGLAVTYSSTTPSICTVVGGTGVLTLLAAGTCTIAANQSGNGTYAAAPQVTQDVAVSLNPQTITFDAAPTGVTVGASGVSVHAHASSSLAVTYSSTTPSICTVVGGTGALTLLAIGTCTIAANQAGNGTYAAAPQVTQDVAVAATPAPSLGLVAAAVEPNFAAAGNVLHFSFTLTNTGNVVLDGPFGVTSAKVDPVTCPATATLALGASIVCTGTYTVTAADVTAGSVVVTASGQGLVGGEVPVVTETSAVTVLKTQPAATPTPVQSVLAATAAASQAVTAPPTSTSGDNSSGGSTPLFALLICLAFAGLGLLAVQAQRRTVRS